ncbi:hypothetical protein K3495_g12029 [Podosphaera aphanis]|nr:hypothetical protein K3495_g12029 [Podosphaera aphanis]
MLENAPSHSAARTIHEFREKFITLISWPPNPSDSNPAEGMWDIVKD